MNIDLNFFQESLNYIINKHELASASFRVASVSSNIIGGPDDSLPVQLVLPFRLLCFFWLLLMVIDSLLLHLDRQLLRCRLRQIFSVAARDSLRGVACAPSTRSPSIRRDWLCLLVEELDERRETLPDACTCECRALLVDDYPFLREQLEVQLLLNLFERDSFLEITLVNHDHVRHSSDRRIPSYSMELISRLLQPLSIRAVHHIEYPINAVEIVLP